MPNSMRDTNLLKSDTTEVASADVSVWGCIPPALVIIRQSTFSEREYKIRLPFSFNWNCLIKSINSNTVHQIFPSILKAEELSFNMRFTIPLITLFLATAFAAPANEAPESLQERACKPKGRKSIL